MIFLSLIVVLAIVNWTTLAPAFQKDAWFIWLINRLKSLPAAVSFPILPMVLAFAIPLIIVVALILFNAIFNHARFAQNFLFFLYVPVLLYSLGRGNFIEEVNSYISAANTGDNVLASKYVDEMCGRAATDGAMTETNDWKSLHTQALKVISYRGFERTFAVLFWFVIAGAIGALLYRLSVIYREQTTPNTNEAMLADKWLWLIEFPAVRLMGLTWAFVGNFDSCPLSDSFSDTENTSMTILNNSLRGALSAPTDLYLKPEAPQSASTDDNVQLDEEAQQAEENAREVLDDLVGINVSTQSEPAYSFALVKSSVPLYSRSLLFWIGAIAFATLFI